MEFPAEGVAVASSFFYCGVRLPINMPDDAVHAGSGIGYERLGYYQAGLYRRFLICVCFDFGLLGGWKAKPGRCRIYTQPLLQKQHAS